MKIARHEANSQRSESALRSVMILGVPVHNLTMAQTLQQIETFMAEPGLHQIATVNPEFVMATQKDVEFRQILRTADLCLADGIGLVLASKWLRQPLPERVPGSELVYHLAGLAAQRGWRLFFLGAAPGVAAEAAAILKAHYPGLIVAGVYAGSSELTENEAIVQRINSAQADLLYVAYGAPKQDKWIARNRKNLATVRLAIGVGGALDFISGRATRAPQWLQRLGLEWLYRLYRQPWRWRRMLALPHFALRILVAKAGHKR